MGNLKLAGMGAIAASALMLALTGGAFAQAHHYTLGGVPTPAALKQSIAQAPVFRDFLPAAVDLSRYMPPVGDQGQQGSCVGWATAYAARAYYAEQIEHRDTTQKQNVPSPAWLFDIIHIGDDCEQGAYIPDAMNVLMTGAYSLADFPYDDTKCPRPPARQRVQASDFKIESFEQVWDQENDPDLDKVKGALSQGNPVVILASVDDAFQNLTPTNSIWRSDASTPGDGHAVTLVGYDDRTQTFKFINQWTTDWGDKGYGRMTYDTFKDRVYEGFIMHLPGDPQVTLTQADFTPDVVEAAPQTNKFVPPILNVRPDEASRDIGAGLPQVDLGTLTCGKVDLSLDSDGNAVATGFVGTQSDLDRGAAGAAAFQLAAAEARYQAGPGKRLQALDPALAAQTLAHLDRGEIGKARDDVKLTAQTLGEVTVSRATIVGDAAVIVFREGLEAVLILAVLTASFVGARRHLRPPVLVGAVLGLVATAITWVIAQTIVHSLSSGGLELQAITGLLATSGIVAVVIGLALQNTLADVFSGFAVGLDQPFNPGDRVAISGEIEGVVVQLNWRSIRIETDGEDLVTIPNSIVAKSHIINRTSRSERRLVSVQIVTLSTASADRVIELLGRQLEGRG